MWTMAETHRPFDDPRPLEEWPDAERLRFIRYQTRRIPGALGVMAIALLIDEVERLMERVAELEAARPRSGNP